MKITDELRRNAYSKNDEARRLAAEELGLIESEEASELLISLLGDASWRVREAAIKSLTRSAGNKNIEALFLCLADENVNLRNSAMKVLTRYGEPVVHYILEHIDEEDERGKILSILTLGEIKSNLSVPKLIEILSNGEEINVRYEAAEALGKIGDQRAVDPLAKVMSEDPWLLYPALVALGNIGDSRAVDPILQLLEEEVEPASVIEALGSIGNEKVLPYIFNYFIADDPEVRGTSLEAIVKIIRKLDSLTLFPFESEIIKEQLMEALKGKSVILALKQCLQSGDFNTGRNALLIAGKSGESGLIPFMLDFLENDELREDAEKALLSLGSKAVKEILKAALEVEGPALTSLLNCLADIVPRKKIDVTFLRLIKKVVEGGDDEAVICAIRATAATGDGTLIKIIEPCLEHRNDYIRSEAVRAYLALCKSGDLKILQKRYFSAGALLKRSVTEIISHRKDEQAREFLMAAVKDPDGEVRSLAVEALGDYPGNEEAVELLIFALSDEDETVIEGAAKSLGRLKARNSLKPLVALLENDNKWIRYYAAQSLGQIGGHEAVKGLRRLLSDNESNVVIGAIQALSRLEDRPAAGMIEDLAGDEERDVREAVALALGKISASNAGKVLEKLTDDPEWNVRAAAASTLGTIGNKKTVPQLLRLLKDPETEVVFEAIRALKKLKALDKKQKKEIFWDLFGLFFYNNQRSLINETINSFTYPGYLEDITEFLRHAGTEDKQYLIGILSSLRERGSSRLLIGALSDKDEDVRRLSALALGNLGTQEALEFLNSVSKNDKAQAVREAASRAVRHILSGG